MKVGKQIGSLFSWTIILIGLFGTRAFASHGVGNPGNAFDVLMVSACENAYRIIKDDFWTGENAPLEVRNFMSAHKSDFLRSIQKCDLRFTDSVYPIELPGIEPSCARTNVDPELSGQSLDTIFLSRTTCMKQGIDEASALLMIFHENIHHLIDPEFSNRPDHRISDEAFCNNTSTAILSSWQAHLESQQVKWQPLPDSPPQSVGRSHHSSLIVSGPSGDTELLVWGGCFADESAIGGCNQYLRSGLNFNLSNLSWGPTEDPLIRGYVPDERARHSAIWTGADSSLPNRMVIWGGCNGALSCFNSLNDGGVFDPKQKSWAPLNDEATHRPSPRTFHSGVWTDRGMVVWGGLKNYDSPEPGVSPLPLGDGAVWQPSPLGKTSAWLPMPTLNQPAPRSHHSTTWTGHQMIVWGGCSKLDLNSDCIDFLNDGAVFDVSTMTWESIPRGQNAPNARASHLAFWTGELLLIWGGEDAAGVVRNGAIYSPKLKKWYAMATQPAAGASGVNATWANDRMVLWGGIESNSTEIFEYFPPAGDQLEFGGIWQMRRIENSQRQSSYGTFLPTYRGILQWGGVTTEGTYPVDGAVLRN